MFLIIIAVALEEGVLSMRLTIMIWSTENQVLVGKFLL